MQSVTQRFSYFRNVCDKLNAPKFPKALGSLHLNNFRTYSNTDIHSLKVKSLSPSFFTRLIVFQFIRLTQPTTSPNPSLVRRGMINDYCNEPTCRPHCGRGIPASTIGRTISLPQCGSVKISGLLGNSKLSKAEL